MMNRFCFFQFAIPFVLIVSQSSPCLAVDLHLELLSDQFDNPDYVIAPPNDTERLFVVEQYQAGQDTGYIWIIKNGALLPDPFLAIPSVATDFSGGLLCLAFDPNYTSNGYFYVFYTDAPGAGEPSGPVKISRFTVSANPNLADPGSEHPILTIPQPHRFHPGGWLGFGPDGTLYISSGDGGPAEDPFQQGQAPNTLRGKILRIDVHGDDFPADPDRNYAIAPGNPFVGQVGLDEIWAYGLREPWRCSFDSLTGDFYIADVGQENWEEVNFQDANSLGGENYGWRCREGSHDLFADPECSGQTFVDPIYEYPIFNLPECSITGGYVYRGGTIPALQGKYIFADWCTSQIWSFRYTNGIVSDFELHTIIIDTSPAPTLGQINSFGTDGCGELTLTTFTGQVFKIVPENPVVLIGDLNNNRRVTVTDFSLLSSQWGQTGPAIPADLDDNQIVNTSDMSLFSQSWLKICPTVDPL